MAFLNAVFDSDLIFAIMLSSMAIFSLMRQRDMSKFGAVLTGLSLIGFAAWITYHMQIEWFPVAEKMAENVTKKEFQITADQIKKFESHVNFFLWLLPFVTASFGTNILSDALLRTFTYEDDWIVKRIVCDIVSGKSIWGSKRDAHLPFETRRDNSLAARRELQILLSDLPQFTAVGEMGRIINMTDGSVVMPYTPSNDGDVFACKLTISWQREIIPVDVDAAQYLGVQLQFASTLGGSVARFRRKANEIFNEISGR